MAEIQRYDVNYDSQHGVVRTAEQDGNWVSYDDHLAAIAARDAEIAARDEALELCWVNDPNGMKFSEWKADILAEGACRAKERAALNERRK